MDEVDVVEALLRRMTLAEKIGQLNLLSAGEGPETGSASVRGIRERLAEGRVGAIFGTKSVASVRAWQEIALAGSRLGIPLFFAEDVIHGHRTVFPLPIGLASAFDPALWREAARVAATEAAAEGINQVYAPMIDVTRDPRWGRVAESPGEDSWLASRYAEAMVEGFQGTDLSAPDTVAACLKHFLAYGAAEGGRDYDNASLAPEDVIGIYAEPFRRGIAVGAASLMPSFNALNKRPMHAHHDLLTGWLRSRLGFDGLIVSDYTGIAELVAHGLGDEETAAALALLAGVDMDMMGEVYVQHLPGLAETGLSRPQSRLGVDAASIVDAIDRSCRRVLTLKHRLGLFEDPFRYCDAARAGAAALAPAHRQAARRAIAASTVLLKNDGTLPLERSSHIALVGAMADDRSNMLGTWAVSGDPGKAVTIREGLAALHDGPITVAKGADIVADGVLAARLNVHGPTVFLDQRPPDAMLEEAVAAARDADVIVAVVGEAKEHSGESSSCMDVRLPAPQRRLVETLAACGPPLVLVVLAGRPLAMAHELALADAVLYAWFAGTEAGNGIADVLTGAAEPSGRLPITFPVDPGQIPVHHDAEPTGRPFRGRFEKFRTGYLDLPDPIPPATGLVPFGFGFSYTHFEIGPPRVDRAHLSGPDDTAVVRVTVTNTGARRGSEVIQLYLSDPVARITRPARVLRGFEKVTLDPGETVEVRFVLRHADLAYPMGEALLSVDWVFDPGSFILSTGRNARDLESVTITWDL